MKKSNEKHGLCKHRIYRIWVGMKQRCNDTKTNYFKNYGGRGIKVCERWNKFENFRDDMLPTYQDGVSLDRINNSGDYEPNNCRWATAKEQANNTRKQSRVRPTKIKSTFNKGKKKVAQIKDGKVIKIWDSQLEAAEALGLNQALISFRCRNTTKTKKHGGFGWRFA